MHPPQAKTAPEEGAISSLPADAKPIEVRDASAMVRYLPGLSQPCVVVELALASEASRPAVDALDRLMAGSLPVSRALHEAHPDKLALAIRAAREVGLDFAGVDLLMPDIGRSWLETGATICEINAQPQCNPGVYADILRRLVETDGRIPVVGVLGGDDRGLCRRISQALAPYGCPGTATPDVKSGWATPRSRPPPGSAAIMFESVPSSCGLPIPPRNPP